MSEQDSRSDEQGSATPTRRLSRARWLLAASAAAIGVVTVSANGSPLLALATFAGVAAVAAFAPQGTRAMRRAELEGASRQTAIDRLSALRLAAAVPDPLIVFDSTGIIVHANPAAEVTFGAVLRGVDLQLRFRAPEMQELIRGTLSGNSSGAAIDYAERLPIERLYRVSASAVGEGTGLFVLVFKDQSEVRRIDRMRADFIANASHELRTPLASIAGFIETLRGPAKDDPNARDRFLGIMHEQTSRMARLIDDLLSLSRLEMKPFVKPGETADVVQVANSVADALGQLAADAGVAIERDLPAEPVFVPGSRDELTQVLANLLENAIKYGQSGKRVIIAVRTVDRTRREVDVVVRDFGPGLAEEHIPRVTERFYRVDVDSSRTQKGTGLGLAIVKHILTRHNGRLSITSQPGPGATFVVHLPAEQR